MNRQKAERHSPAQPEAAIVSSQFMPNSVAGNAKMKAKQSPRDQKVDAVRCVAVQNENSYLLHGYGVAYDRVAG
jgi:hypothetical protein